jgi:succinate dehydrogenase hydrophobic anchor subunit
MQNGTGYGRKSWKKWLAIYLVAGAIAYFVIYLVFFAHSSGGGGGFGY